MKFISLDIETTGLDKRIDRVIEFGAVKFDLEGNSENLQILINPGTKIPEFITYLTGITDEELKDAPSIEEASEQITNFIGDSIIIGHFVQFDIDFLRSKGLKIENDFYDTSELARIFFPGLPSYSLEILSGILNLTHEEKHRALDDSIAAQELFFKTIDQVKSLPEDLYNQIINIASKSSWKFAETLKTIQRDPSISAIKTTTTEVEKNFSGEDEKIINIIHSAEGIKLIETFNESQYLPEKITEELNKDATKKNLILVPKDLFDITKDEYKIGDDEFYISIQRLEKFKQKESFTPPETTALIKILIWLKETKTGFLYENLSLNQDEKKIIQHVKTPEGSQKVERNQNNKNTQISDHRYLPENSYDKTIIFDAFKFIENFQSSLSIFTNFKKASEPLDSLNNTELKNKLETIFGILDNFLPNQISEYGENYTVQESDLNNSNWQRMKETVQFLIQESQNFKDIISEETTPYLQDWKKILKELESIFINTNFKTHFTVIQKSRNNEIFVKQIAKTSFIREKFAEFKARTKNIIFVGKAIDEGNNGKFIKSILGINEETKIEKVMAPEEIIKKSQIFTVNDIKGKSYDNMNETIDFIKTFLRQEKGQSVIIFNSGRKLDQTHQILAPKLKKEGINMFAQKSSGGAGKITEMYKKSPATSSILITPNKWESFDHTALSEQEDFKTIIIHCLPFDPPSDPFINALGSGFPDQWGDFSIPSAILQLKKIIGKFLYKTPGRIIILDSRILEKSYSSEFLKALSEFTTPTEVSAQELLKIL